ncbi:dihydrolipoyl dehydrogenase family protein [Arthrobacter rhombi]|uniref:dihydrolipoyl dehydrogenase family protein n=1 Tax=Arthrobacter rhombi TaxID=71253 RepID=UPI003FD049A3
MTARDRTVEFLVVGGGAAGMVGAMTAAEFGVQTLLVEQERTGGDCLYFGCVPSKTLLTAAKASIASQQAAGEALEFSTVREHIAAAIRTIEPMDSPQALRAAGVEVLQGTLRFRGPGVAEVEGRTIRFRQGLLATGSTPSVPHIPGLDPALTVTSEGIWDLTELPDRLVIIGGGPVGCEIGQAFARLGSKVTLVVRSRLLPKEDQDAADILRRSLEADGLRILENIGITEATRAAGGARLLLDTGEEVDADLVLLATGRRPRTRGLGLEHLGVELDGQGRIVTDGTLRTSNPSVRAAGDVTTHEQFTHVAGTHGSVAASNAALGLRRRIPSAVPRVTFTSPEVAAVGRITASKPGDRVHTRWHDELDRAITAGRTQGYTRIVVDRKGKLVGGTIVGPRAGDQLSELTLAVRAKLGAADIAGTIHPYPTYSEALQQAALEEVRGRLAAPPMSLVLGLLARIRRARLARKPQWDR